MVQVQQCGALSCCPAARAGLRQVAPGEGAVFQVQQQAALTLDRCPAARAGLRQVAPGEGAVVQVQQWGPLLLYSTQRGGLHAWDLRMDRDAWQLPAAPSQASQVGRGCLDCCRKACLLPSQQAAGD